MQTSHRIVCFPFIYLFYLLSFYIAHFSIVSMLKCAVQVMRWRDTRATQASHLYEKIDAHTMYNQWATAPGRSLNYPRPKSITHLRTFSDNGVYVALQLFLVIVVSDQWRRVLIPYSYRQAPWGPFYMLGDGLSRYTWGPNGFTWFPSHGRHTLQCWKPGFYTLQILVAAGDRTHDLLTTRPTCLPLSHGSLPWPNYPGKHI